MPTDKYRRNDSLKSGYLRIEYTYTFSSVHISILFQLCKMRTYFFCKNTQKKQNLNSSLNKHNIMHISRAISRPIFKRRTYA